MMFSGQLGNKVAFSVGKFFFDREQVLKQLNRSEKSRLSKAGAFVRRRARSSIRPARRKRVAELDDAERLAYFSAVERAKAAGRKPPKIWYFAHSKPGEPPRSIFGLLREHLYFVYDPATRSVVVGPAKLNGSTGSVPAVLEHGGNTTNSRGRSIYIAARPFMQPALEAEVDKFPELFRNALN